MQESPQISGTGIQCWNYLPSECNSCFLSWCTALMVCNLSVSAVSIASVLLVGLGDLGGLRQASAVKLQTKRALSTSSFSMCLATVCPAPPSNGLTTLLGFPWLTETLQNSRNANLCPWQRWNPCNDTGNRLTGWGRSLLKRTGRFL